VQNELPIGIHYILLILMILTFFLAVLNVKRTREAEISLLEFEKGKWLVELP